MTLEQAIQDANALIARQKADGPESVTNQEIHDALAAIRASRSEMASSRRSAKQPSEPVDLDALFGE